MANRRFIDFPIATTVGDSDIILIWQSGVNKQTTKATFLSGLPENLDELNDVAISGLTNGQILRYDSTTGKWENTDQGNLDLNDLNDVSIVSPSNGQVLVYNSSTSKWENSSGGFVPYTGAVTTVNLGAQTIQAGQFVKAGGTSSQFLKADGSIDSTAYGTGSVTSVGLTMPSAFSVANSPVTTAGTLAVTGAGTVAQYIRGDGSLADFPEASGGGSSISYYLNGSVNQGTIGGVAYKELNKVPILGAGTDFTINANGYIASFLTDASDPNLLEIPGGNWNFETYFSASSGGGSPTFYVELYKYNGTTFTLLASNSTFPELIAFGTNVTAYFSTLAVPTTTLALTDRLAIRYYVTHSGRTITMHTEDNHLCQIITTFTTGLTALNGLTAQVQNFAVGTSGTDFAISSATATHTFNLPTASATNRGALSSADWTTFNGKQNALTLTTTGSSGAATLVGSTLNIPNYSPDLSGYVPTSRTITINGTTQDLSANRTFNVGTVTSVGLSSATSGVTIGSTPVTGSGTITLAIATASGSQNGLLSSTDWTTFNSKQNALTNPVTGTGTTNYITKFTGATTVGNSQVFDNGTNVGIGTASPTEKLDVLGVFRNLMPSDPATGMITAKFLSYSLSPYGLIFRGYSSGVHSIQSQREGNDGQLFGLSLQPLGGNVLIGTTTDAGQRLQVSGSIYLLTGGNRNIRIGSATNYYYDLQSTNDDFQIIEAGSTPRLTIKYPNGNVGIGTTNPSGLLHVKSSGAYGSLLVDNTGTTGGGYFASLQNGSTKGIIAVTGAIEGNTTSDFGMFAETGGGLRFYVNGLPTSSMRLFSTGNLSIGSTTDTSYKLFVNGNTYIRSAGNTSGSFGLVLQDSGANNLFLVRNDGAATFSSTLDTAGRITITADSGNEQFTIRRASNNNLQLISGVHSSGYASIQSIEQNVAYRPLVLNRDGGNVLIGTTTDAGYKLDVNGTGRFSGDLTHAGAAATSILNIYTVGGTVYNYSGVSGSTNSIINGSVLGDTVIRTINKSILFSTNNGSTSALTITSSGNVGIGTSSPGYKTVIQTANQTTGLLVTTNANDSETGLYIQPDHTNGIVKLFASGGTNKAFAFLNGNTEAMRITSGGNVIIGSTSDNGSKLQVNGAIRTAQPVGTTSNGWLLGRALISGTSTPDRWIRVQIGLEYYDILAVYMGTL